MTQFGVLFCIKEFRKNKMLPYLLMWSGQTNLAPTRFFYIEIVHEDIFGGCNIVLV